MSLNRKRLIISLCVMSILSSTPARAETTCKDVITACDSALDSKNKEIQLNQLAIRQLTDQNTVLASDLTDAHESLNSWYRNPFVVGSIGALLGIFVAGGLHK